ncbi:MAG TPA: FAD-dependent oxidoreductase [Chloroflexota bacterium]|nr:FAD-dependent oxidoreductase [Chloroflexota bacterium]
MAPSWDETADLICVGSGLAGVAAALAAADAGMDALLLEKSDQLGGSTAHSYGILWVPNNHLEKAQGVADDAGTSRRYMRWLGGERQSAEHVETYVEDAPRVLEYFQRTGDIPFYPIALSDHYYPVGEGSTEFGRSIQVEPFEAHSLGEWQPKLRHSKYVERITWEEMKAWGGRANERGWDHTLIAQRDAADVRTFGAGLIGHFVRAALAKGVRIRTGSGVERLVVEDGAVLGVVGAGKAIRARHGVILGTGLYGANERLVSWFDEFPPMPTYREPSTSGGDGLIVAMEHGAGIQVQHGTLAIHLAYQVPGETIEGVPSAREVSIRELASPHSILVNLDGNRFCDESFFQGVDIRLREFDLWRHRHINLPCFIIFDHDFWDAYAIEPCEPGGPVPDWIASGDTPAEVASQLGIDAEQLERTVDRFNRFADAGRDEDFHRGESIAWVAQAAGDLTKRKNQNLGPVRRPPFHGLHVFPSHTRSVGLVTDTNGQVIHVRGHAIPGLYACGELAAQLHVGTGYQAGFTLTGAMTFGYRSVQHAKAMSC